MGAEKGNGCMVGALTWVEISPSSQGQLLRKQAGMMGWFGAMEEHMLEIADD